MKQCSQCRHQIEYDNINIRCTAPEAIKVFDKLNSNRNHTDYYDGLLCTLMRKYEIYCGPDARWYDAKTE